MKTLIPRIIIFIFAIFAAVFPVPSKSAQDQTRNGRIEGIVVSPKGEPVPYAHVTVPSSNRLFRGQEIVTPSYTVASDAAGRFVIKDVPPGISIYLRAQKAGFIDTGDLGPFKLEARESVVSLRLLMTPQSVISGRVIDAEGAPVEGAFVAEEHRAYWGGVRQMINGGEISRTNDLGEFRIPGLTSGRYYLQATDTVGMVSGEKLVSIPTYYGSSADLQDAIPIDLQPGQELHGVQIRILKSAAFTVTGKVVVPSGVLALPVTVYVLTESTANGPDRTGGAFRSGNTRPDGSFEFRDLPQGSYVLQANSSESIKAVTAGQAFVNVKDANITGVVIDLNRTARIQGTLRMDVGDLEAFPKLDAEVGQEIMRRPSPHFSLTNASGVSHTSLPNVELKPDGKFEIENVIPGKYDWSVTRLPPGMYVKSIRTGGVDATNGLLILAAEDVDLTITLAKGAASLSGAIRTGKCEPQSTCVITLWNANASQGATSNGIRFYVNPPAGVFQFQDLPPGTYFAAAWEDIDQGIAQAREFLDLMKGVATRIQLTEGSHVNIDLKLIPAAQIRAAEERLP